MPNTGQKVGKFRAFVKQNAVIGAFLLVALAGGYAIDQTSERDNENFSKQLRSAQVQECERSNDTRNQMNTVVRASETSNEVVAEFMRDASKARKQAGNEKVAERYEELASKLVRDVQFRRLPLTDCERVVPKP